MLIAKCDVCGKTSEIELDYEKGYECKEVRETRENIARVKICGEKFDLCFDCSNEIREKEKKFEKQILEEIKKGK